jgi:ABC-type multidrug transport system fused ATPase/permease subunit
MKDTIYKMMDMLTPKERRSFYVLMFFMLFVGLFEMIGVASVFPFISVLSNPSIIESNEYLNWAYTTLGFQSTDSFLIFLGFATFAMIMTSILVNIGSLYVITRFSHMRAYTMSGRLLRGYLRQPYAWFLNRHSADLGKVILSEVDSVVKQALLPALRIVSGIFVVLFIVGLLVAIRPAVALGVAAFLLVAYVIVFVISRRSFTRYGAIRFAANGERYQIAQEAMGGIKDVKLLGLEDSYIRRFQKPARRMAMANTRVDVLGEAPRFLLQGIAFGAMMLVLLVLLMSGNDGLAGMMPVLAVYAFAGLRLLPAFQTVYAKLSRLRFAQPVVDALHRDFKDVEALEREAKDGPAAPLRLREAIELVDVHYAYPLAERQALNGLSIRIPANTRVGIVGGTGAGKTTAVDIMLGLLDPQAGALRVDGRAITPALRRAWQSTIGYVPQHIFLTDDSVAANIAFGIPPEKIDHAAVERAARVAELHDFVMGELPEGYETFVGERGVRLSGGQRQRIGIARALYHDPDVLIMDEATSALDNLTERAVMDAVHNLGRAKTVVLIAHRLSTVRDCDTIFMLEGGRLVAEGSYDALIAENRQFRALAVGRPAE